MKSIILLVVLIFTSTYLFGQECTFRLTGHVHSTATHENLPYATVVLNGTGRTIITDINGDFRFDGLCAGTYTIHINHNNFDSAVRTVTLSRNVHIDVDLIPSTTVLSEVTITGVRGLINTGIKRELTGKELEETRGASLAEALSKLGGVTMLQTGSTIAKPIIHGLHSNRILTINNGIRQEGQQWGNEHAPEIDPFIANRLTVIKGVDELRYGSDAIGGVILVEPRSLRMTPGYNAEINSIFFTNNRQYVTSAIWEQQLKKWPSFTYRLQGTYKKGANIKTPNYRLNNTGLEEKNFSLTAGLRREHFNTEVYYSLFNTQVGIFTGSHIGNLSDLLIAIDAPRPDPVYTGQNTYQIDRPSQDVTHHLLKWKTGFDINNNNFNIILAAQYNNRKEFDVVRNTTRGAQIDLDIFTISEEINWEHPKKHNLNGVVGLVAMQQDNSYSGRYLVPNYRSYSYGAYFIEKWTKDKWDLQAGLRYDTKEINTNRLQTASGILDTYNFDFSTLASSFNAGYKIIPEWKVNSNIAFSTRAPHVNELLTNGIHHGAGTYEVGDITLKPEKSFNISFNNNYISSNNKIAAELTVYRNAIDNFIYQQPKPDEPVLTIRGAFPKIVYESTDAVLSGMDASAKFNVLQPLALTSRYSMVRGRNRLTDDWLIGMPSDRISNELTYLFSNTERFNNSYVSVELQHVLEQTRVPDEKNGPQDYKLPPAGYSLLNADISTSFTMGSFPVTLALSGRNLLNKSYREYLNSFRYFTDEIGRTFILRLKIGLQTFY
jgi:iron complex outermembrane recepter protein